MAELVSRVYAKAMFEAAFESKKHNDIKDELQFVKDCLTENQELYLLWRSPLINVSEKKKIFTNIFQNSLSQEALNFLQIIIDKKREKYIMEMIEVYHGLVDKANNVIEATAVTAVPMDENILLQLQSKLSALSGRNVRLKNEIKQDLIGGVLISMGDKIIDGTIKNQLERMKEQLSQIIV